MITFRDRYWEDKDISFNGNKPFHRVSLETIDTAEGVVGWYPCLSTELCMPAKTKNFQGVI